MTTAPPPTYAYVERIVWDSSVRAGATRAALAEMLGARLATWTGELPADRVNDRWEGIACGASGRERVVVVAGGRYRWNGGDVVGDVVTVNVKVYDCRRTRTVAIAAVDAGASDATASEAWRDAVSEVLDRLARRLRAAELTHE